MRILVTESNMAELLKADGDKNDERLARQERLANDERKPLNTT
jgi:hypothetical protein